MPDHADLGFVENDHADLGFVPVAAAPADTHPLWQKAVHYGAKALPAAGAIGFGVAGGAAGIPTGPGALATAAASAGLGGMAGKAGQKAVDQYLGYEQPDLKRDVQQVGMQGLEDATSTTGFGTASALTAKALPFVSALLKSGAIKTGRRVLTNVLNPLSKAKPLADEAVKEAFDQGAIKLGGTGVGANERLDELRDVGGDAYSKIVRALKGEGLTGPDATALAQKYTSEGSKVAANSMLPAVPQTYENAAQQLATKPTTQTGLGALPNTTGNFLDLEQAENLKRSMQGMAKAAYKQQMPTELGRAHEATASMMREAIENEIERQAPFASNKAQDLASQFVPVKQQLGRIIAASNAAREGAAMAGNRSFFSLPDLMAFSAEMGRSANPVKGALATAGMHLARTRGPSSVAAGLYQGSRLADWLAPQMMRNAPGIGSVVGPMAAEAPRPAWLDELLAAVSRNRSAAPPQLADASQQ